MSIVISIIASLTVWLLLPFDVRRANKSGFHGNYYSWIIQTSNVDWNQDWTMIVTSIIGCQTVWLMPLFAFIWRIIRGLWQLLLLDTNNSVLLETLVSIVTSVIASQTVWLLSPSILPHTAEHWGSDPDSNERDPDPVRVNRDQGFLHGKIWPKFLIFRVV